MALLIKATRTGNKVFGSKAPPSENAVNIAGVKLCMTETDTWSSGEHPGDGEYILTTWLETVSPVDLWPNIKQAKQTTEHEA